MSVSRGDVVLVDDPFTDRKDSKVRPALVVQADRLNQQITDTILAAVSRSTHRASAIVANSSYSQWTPCRSLAGRSVCQTWSRRSVTSSTRR
ncbi:MAG: hypothetical protein B7Z73_15995 [Planctomycetia bacterium 21-64-5]|nr:MAG: hypothetical protein B7Z73_15995 [Planctomycetia bacterium 21-64-5]